MELENILDEKQKYKNKKNEAEIKRMELLQKYGYKESAII